MTARAAGTPTRLICSNPLLDARVIGATLRMSLSLLFGREADPDAKLAGIAMWLGEWVICGAITASTV